VIAQMRSELLKLRSTRTTLGLVIGLIALLLLTVLLTALLTKARDLSSEDNQRDLLTIAGIANVFSALCGVLLVTSEFRFGTIRSTVLVTPRRPVVVGAKLAAGVLAGLALAVLTQALVSGIGYGVLAARGIPIELGAGERTRLLVGGLASIALWGGIGVGVGTLVRNQVGAVIGLLAWVLFVEHLLFALVPSVGRLMPTQAASALLGQRDEHFVPAGAGAVLLVAWAALLTAAGVALFARRDVD
jgi:ABC-2 type transport system permease protein